MEHGDVNIFHDRTEGEFISLKFPSLSLSSGLLKPKMPTKPLGFTTIILPHSCSTFEVKCLAYNILLLGNFKLFLVLIVKKFIKK